MSAAPRLNALVRTLRLEAPGILSVELIPLPGEHFPPFEPGAHIDVHASTAITRSYSLCNSPNDRDRYVLGILNDPRSRGGSRFLHANLRPGMVLEIGAPRNNFALDETAASSLLIAGGIGITPVLCMYRRLQERERPVRLIYGARSRSHAAFLDEILQLGGDVELHFDDEHGGAPIDFSAVFAGVDAGTHAYCCGPEVMLRAFEAACASAGIASVHVERFAAAPVETPAERHGFVVELARSGLRLPVSSDRTILQVVLDAGIALEHSCEEGVCGACETRVVAGIPDHRDLVLSTSERAGNKTMMVCVSRSKTEHLVLDL